MKGRLNGKEKLKRPCILYLLYICAVYSFLIRSHPRQVCAIHIFGVFFTLLSMAKFVQFTCSHLFNVVLWQLKFFTTVNCCILTILDWPSSKTVIRTWNLKHFQIWHHFWRILISSFLYFTLTTSVTLPLCFNHVFKFRLSFLATSRNLNQRFRRFVLILPSCL